MGSTDRITSVRLSHVDLPLSTPISDAKVLTGRQRPLTAVAFLSAEDTAGSGHRGLGLGHAKRAGPPLAKLLGAHRESVDVCDTSGGFLSSPLEQVLDNADRARARGVGGIKIKLGTPDPAEGLRRVEAVRTHLRTAYR